MLKWILFTQLLFIFYLYSRLFKWCTSNFPVVKDAKLLLFSWIKIGLIDVNISGPIMFFITASIILCGVRYCHLVILFVMVYLFQILIKLLSQLWSLLRVVSSLNRTFLAGFVCSDSLFLPLLLVGTPMNLVHDLGDESRWLLTMRLYWLPSWLCWSLIWRT